LKGAVSLRAEAAAFGVADRFEPVKNVSDAAVCEAFARAKTSVILSRREGSCVAVGESLFANTPVGLYEDAGIGSRFFINGHTGRLLQHAHMGRQLMGFIGEAHRYMPPQWTLENRIDCHGSTAQLNNVLRGSMLGAGQEWMQVIALHHWRPDPMLVHAADRKRLQPTYTGINVRFGLRIGTDSPSTA
jgi:hypothetical protein